MKNLEEKILEISAKLGNEVHLKAIRNTFISMLPIMIFGGIFAVIGATSNRKCYRIYEGMGRFCVCK